MIISQDLIILYKLYLCQKSLLKLKLMNIYDHKSRSDHFEEITSQPKSL